MLTRRVFDFPGMGRRNPFVEMERMRREMEQLSASLFGSSGTRPASSGVFPALNLTEDSKTYYVRAELPGIKIEDIDIQVHGHNLMISGERKIHQAGENVRYHRREREAGKFSKVIGLPCEMNGENVSAKLVNGVLTVSIVKPEVVKPKKITVN